MQCSSFSLHAYRDVFPALTNQHCHISLLGDSYQYISNHSYGRL